LVKQTSSLIHRSRTHFSARPALAAVCCVVAFFGAGQAKAQLTGPSAPPKELALDAPGEVVKVEFVGNTKISTPELQSVVATHVTSGLEKFIHSITFGAFGSGPYMLDRATLDRDTAAIVGYYRDNGYLSARAEYVVNAGIEGLREIQRLNRVNQSLPQGKRVKAPELKDTVIFLITEGAVSKIHGVSFEGLELIPNEFQPQLTDSSTIKVGTRYTRKQVAGEVTRLETFMSENGYPYFKHDSTIVENTNLHRDVRVLLYFNAGHRYKFGPIRIEYDTASPEDSRVAERVVKHQFEFQPGEWFRSSSVRKTEQALYRLGTFDLVRVTLDTSVLEAYPDSARDGTALPVIVRLRMKHAKEVAPGVYFGTGRTTVFGGTVTYTDRNAFQEAGNLTVQGLYQFPTSNQRNFSVSADIYLPDIGIRHVPITAGLRYSDQWQADSGREVWSDRNAQARFGTIYIIGDPDQKTTLSPEAIAEYVRHDDPSTRRDHLRHQVNSIFALSFQRDLSNDFFNPSHGWFLGVASEVGLPILSGLAPEGFHSSSYWKSSTQGKIYFDISSDSSSILANRLRVGYTRKFKPEDDTRDMPYDRRFFVGGATSIRGWQSKELLVSCSDDEAVWVGGYYMIEANMEWRWAPWQYPYAVTTMQKLLNPLRIATFLEAGQAWDYGIKPQWKHLGIAGGLGLHYNTPFGTLRADFGLKLFDPNPDYGVTKGFDPRAARPDEPGRWIFNRPFKRDVYSFHFGIGQAF
jgi:outer membrane protein assembly factor BamA